MHGQPEDSGMLGTSFLGENFLCGKNMEEDVMCWDFRIELMNDCRLEIFVDSGKDFMMDLINKFYDYFVPFEIMVNTKIICHEINQFQLTNVISNGEDKVEKSYLGYNTSI